MRPTALLLLVFLLAASCNSFTSRTTRGVSAVGTETGADGLPRRIVHDETGIEFILVDAGEFTCGSTTTVMAENDEKPPHQVIFSQPYYLAVKEVTVGQWRRYAGEDKVKQGKVLVKPSWAAHTGWSDDYPAVNLTWNDAEAFCKSYGMELPTESQWENACRAGTTGHFCYGDDIYSLEEYAWYGNFDGNADKGAHAVGLLKNNGWGFYDMHGNVWEWCRDVYAADTYAKLGTTVTDPTGPPEGLSRVVRGGSWFDAPKEMRSANRHQLSTSFRDNKTGFRPVIPVKPAN